MYKMKVRYREPIKALT